jgi:hypothetical protein
VSLGAIVCDLAHRHPDTLSGSLISVSRTPAANDRVLMAYSQPRERCVVVACPDDLLRLLTMRAELFPLILEVSPSVVDVGCNLPLTGSTTMVSFSKCCGTRSSP